MSRRPLTRNLPGHARASAAVLQARASAAAFRALLAQPHVRPVAAASVLARLPKGMLPLATVLVLHQSTGSYAIAGIAVAATALGDAASAPARPSSASWPPGPAPPPRPPQPRWLMSTRPGQRLSRLWCISRDDNVARSSAAGTCAS